MAGAPLVRPSETTSPLRTPVRRLETMQLLEVDLNLARRLSEADAESARRAVLVAVIDISAGPWSPPRHAPSQSARLMVLEGLIIRRVSIDPGAVALELLAEEDLFDPWPSGELATFVRPEVAWEAITESRVAILDAAFVRRIAPWPELSTELMFRSLRRAQQAAVLCALGHSKRVEDRVLLLFRHLAERFGRVGRRGIRLPVPLRHRDIADLIGASRPPVSTVLRGLAERGELVREPDGSWLLSLDRAP